MRAVRLVAVSLAATTLALVAGSPAQAAIPGSACKPAGFTCAPITVPVDRTGVVGGTITLATTTHAAASNPTRTAVLGIAGGPGQAALPLGGSFLKVMAPMLAERDLITFDQRGVGKSGQISCASLRGSGGSLFTTVRKCARELGAGRAFYTTAQTVQDIEALRVAGGYDQLVLYGTSYGTKVALAYAAAFPLQTQALILDSVVTPEGPDALDRATLAAVPRAIGKDLCGKGACKGATPHAVADIKKLGKIIDKRDLKASVYTAGGNRTTATMTPTGLVTTLVAGDLNPVLRGQLPGAIRAAVAGDRAPLLRLSAVAGGPLNSVRFQGDGDLESADDALYFATICEEDTTFPWTRGASQARRLKEATKSIIAAPASTFGIFPRSVAFGGLTATCMGWPVASGTPPPPGALPNVPTLMLSGLADLRTPLEDAQSVARRLPQAQLIAVSRVGHSVLGADTSGCATAALAAFAAGGTAQACTSPKSTYDPTNRPPRTLNDVRGARKYPGQVGRTLTAAINTLVDSYDQVDLETYAGDSIPTSVGGLRGGRAQVTGAASLKLKGYSYVPGLRITGTFNFKGTTRVRVSGPAASEGTLTLAADGRVSGRLGGKSVQVSLGSAASAATADEHTWRASLVQARRLRALGG